MASSEPLKWGGTMALEVRAGTAGEPVVAQISARIERLPISGWHWRVLTIVGTADFFDAFDSLTIAFVLPVLAGLWHIAPGQIGLLISSSFVGQALGAIGFSWLAERYGRVVMLMWTLAVVALFSVLCAFTWDFQSLFWTRFIQGLAIGAEIPIAATYMNEVIMARYRGRFIQGIQAIFGFGVLISSFISVQLIPRFGWESMFIVGAVAGLVALPLRVLLPESPRWLANKGRLIEADAILKKIEVEISQHGAQPLPPPATTFASIIPMETRFRSLFEGIYLRRTLAAWLLMFCTSYVGYGLLTWIPSIFVSVYHLPVAEALQDSLIVNFIGFGGTCTSLFFIDLLPRRIFFLTSFLGAGIPLFVLALLGQNASVIELIVWVAIARVFISFALSALLVYVPEVYPTRMRALGSGTATSWMRIASFVGPSIIGLILVQAGVGAVFMMFAGVAAAGVLTAVFLLVESRGRILEELAP
jgi:putative MFS transporter